MHWNMTRARITLQSIEHGETIDVRQIDIEQNRRGHVVASKRQGSITDSTDDALEILFACIIQEDFCKSWIVFNDQDGRIARRNQRPVIERSLVRRGIVHCLVCVRCPAIVQAVHFRVRLLSGIDDIGRQSRCSQRLLLVRLLIRVVVPDIGAVVRQVQRKGTSASELALNANFAAEQTRQFAADRQTETGTAVSTRSTAVSLLECFEDQLQLVCRDTDTGIDNRESEYRFGVRQHRVFGGPATACQCDRQRHPAARCKFECVR